MVTPSFLLAQDGDIMTQQLKLLQGYFEQLYDIELPFSLDRFLLDTCPHATHQATYQPSYETRGGVFLIGPEFDVPSQEYVLDIGLYVSDSLKKTLLELPPLFDLTPANLDAFSVLVEEISHFNLIYQRAICRQHTSLLELEFQAEIDKVHMTHMVLKGQGKKIKKNNVFKIFFEDSFMLYQSHTREGELYKRASDMAAKFWHEMMSHGFDADVSYGSKKFLSAMAIYFRMPLGEKLGFFSNKNRLSSFLKIA